MAHERISVDAAVMGGVPCVRGTRVPVATVLDMFAQGMRDAEVLTAYPYLTGEDLRACLAYAAEVTQERVIALDLTA
ncbi:MAG: DUF433 domain-containing protein [Planctomycetes bacterium]|nr:DUF433 domain-containing protein [Planctomycetota bacterium]